MNNTFCIAAAAIATLVVLCGGCSNPTDDGGEPEVSARMTVLHEDVPITFAQSIDIGPTTLGVEKDVAFLVENSGSKDLHLVGPQPVVLSGSDAPMFAVIRQPTSPVAPGQASSFTIRFTPVDMKNCCVQVSVLSSDPERRSYDFELTRYTEAEVVVKQGGTDIPPGSVHDLGTAQLPEPAFEDFEIHNAGTGELDLTGAPRVSLSGSDAGQFAVASDPDSPILPGGSSPFTLAFLPTSRGTRNATVTVENSDSDEGDYRFTVTGTGMVGEVRVTRTDRTSENASAVWTGAEYGLVWEDYRNQERDLFFTRLDTMGQKRLYDTRITDQEAVALSPSLVWNGTEYGLVWSDTRDGGDSEIYFARISAAGEKQGSDIRVTDASGGSGSPSLVWTGTEYGVTWSDSRDGSSGEIYFARLSTSGAKQGTNVRVTETTASSSQPSLVWTGAEYGLTWRDGSTNGWQIFFTRISSSGVKQGQDVQITDTSGSAKSPSLAWSGAVYGLSWSEGAYDEHEIYFARISSLGVMQSNPLRVTTATGDSRDPSVAWTGTEFGIVWEDGPSSYHYRDVNFVRVSAAGTRIGENRRITDHVVTRSGNAWLPCLVWADTEYGVVWEDTRDHHSQVYFAILDREGSRQ